METPSQLINRLKRETRFDAARLLHQRLVGKLARKGQSPILRDSEAWQTVAREFPPLRPEITIPTLQAYPPLYLPDRKRLEVAWAILTALRSVGIKHAPHYERSRQLLLALAASDVRRRFEKPCRPAATIPDLREGMAFALLDDPSAALDEVTAILCALAEQCSRRRGNVAQRTEREIAMILNELPLLQVEAPTAAAMYGKALLKQFDQRVRTKKGAPSDCQKTRNQIGLTPGGTL